MSSSSQNRRQGRPLPVIDLAQLLGPNFRQRFTPAVGRLNQNVEPEPNQPQQQDEKASNVARMPQNNSSEVPRNRDDNIDNTGHLKPAAKRKSSMSASTNATAKTSSRARNTINQDTQCRGSAEGELAGASAKRDGSIASMATANPEKKRQSSADAMVASKPKKKTALTETSAGVQTQVFTKASGISLFSSNRCVPLEMTPSQVSISAQDIENMKGGWPAETNEVSKYTCTEAGLRGWPRLFQLGHEPDVQRREDENETEELMEQPEGTQEHGI